METVIRRSTEGEGPELAVCPGFLVLRRCYLAEMVSEMVNG